ncbi:UGSC family (seleno)protein [Roseomonas sp. BN140053]|uniref:UGSC family (seleno)protein n=1 Tax=Roseomonas sp. BN140053 TaxID=3391898 RepID=UPI0039EB4AFD
MNVVTRPAIAGQDRMVVHNPVGYPPAITPKSPAPRLDSLDGKTVFLIDSRFDDSVELLKQVAAWFAEKMPGVATELVSLASYYGQDDPALWTRIKAEGHGAIIGVGHCSTCAPAVSTHAVTLETRYGVPTVALHTSKFDKVVRSVTRMAGLPMAPCVFVPQPVMGKTAAELRAYVEGNDPITGRPVMAEVIEGLTVGLAAAATAAPYARTTPRLVEPDTEDALHELFLRENWTDKLPIVLPTEERVTAMLRGTSHAPDEVVGRMQPTPNRGLWECTVEKVAVNAVMAGARPEYFPVILALAASGVTARGSTSSSGSAMAVVNGPIRGEIGMNAGIGAMGPFNHANATIGRAYGLLSQNLQGGSVPGETFLGSLGNGYTYNSLTFAENEERSPWEPLHVGKGFRAEESVVSIFFGCRSTSFGLGLREKYWREHVRDMLLAVDTVTAPVLLLDPITARQFIDRGGFTTKQQLARFIAETAQMPAGRYWDMQLVQNYIYPRATLGTEPMASKLKAAEDELIPMFAEDSVRIVVVGGETNGYWQIMGARESATVSIDAWR